MGTLKADSGGCSDIVEASSFGRHIVGSVTGLDMVVVGAAIKGEVAGGRGFAAIGVVGHFIGAKDVSAIVNLRFVVQFVNFADFFLLDGADDRAIFELRHCPAGTWHACIGG